MTQIKPGDVVRLRSGGPRMTVEKIEDPAGAVTCCYFLKRRVVRETFVPAVIKLIKEAGDA